MKTILVAMHLVACEPDLLICQDYSINAKRWPDMEACQMARDMEMSRLSKTLPTWAVVMSRCRYLLGKGYNPYAMF